MHVEYHNSDISAEEAGLRQTLQEVLHYNQADLEINQTGKLSTPQMTRLVFRSLGPFIGLAGSAAGLIGLSIFLRFGGIGMGIRMFKLFGNIAVLGIGGLFFGAIALVMKLLMTSGRFFMLIADLMEGKVTTVMGRMTTSKAEEIEDGLSTITRQKTHTWSCVIKGEYFDISEEAFNALQDRPTGNFKAYLTPRSRFMVAMEPSGPDPNARDPFKMEYKTSY